MGGSGGRALPYPSPLHRFVLRRHDLVKDGPPGPQHPPDVRVAKLAVVPERGVLLQLLHRLRPRRVGDGFQLGEGLAEAVAPVDVDGHGGYGRRMDVGATPAVNTPTCVPSASWIVTEPATSKPGTRPR